MSPMGGSKTKEPVSKYAKQDFIKPANNEKQTSNTKEPAKKDKSVNNQILQSIKNVNENQSRMAQILEKISSKMELTNEATSPTPHKAIIKTPIQTKKLRKLPEN